jgi:hypothetical protein
MNLFTKFFCICSGANLKVLSECPTEHSKYAGIGGTIFFTACLAAISGAYAVQTITPSIYLSLGFGLFWGTMIFNLDRYIVSSMRKRGSMGKELVYAIPRFLLAVLISFVITKPLEIALFKNQISYQIERDNDLRDKQHIRSKLGKYGSDTLRFRKEQLQLKRTQLKEAIYNAPATFNYVELSRKTEAARNKLQEVERKNNILIEEKNTRIKDLWKEYAKTDDSNQAGSYASLTYTGNRIKNKLTQEVAVLKREITAKQKELKALEEKADVEKGFFQELTQRELEDVEASLKLVDEEIQKAASLATAELSDSGYTTKNYGAGILAELEALENLKASSTVWWASWFLVILFIVLETAPIFAKLMSDRGLYDEILERYEYEVLVQEKQRIAEINKKYSITEEPALAAEALKQTTEIQQHTENLQQTTKASQEAVEKIKALEVNKQSGAPVQQSTEQISAPKAAEISAHKEEMKPGIILVEDQPEAQAIIMVRESLPEIPATAAVEDLYRAEIENQFPETEEENPVNYSFSVNTGYSFVTPSEAEEENFEIIEDTISASPAAAALMADGFVGKLWINKDPDVQESYFFTTNKRKVNKLNYSLDGSKYEGRWEYVNNHHLVRVELNGQSRLFQVTEITNSLLRLHETGQNGKTSYYNCED